MDKDKIAVFDFKNYIYGITFYIFDTDLNPIFRGVEKFKGNETIEDCCERIMTNYDAKYFSFKDSSKKYIGLTDLLLTKNFSYYNIGGKN